MCLKSNETERGLRTGNTVATLPMLPKIYSYLMFVRENGKISRTALRDKILCQLNKNAIETYEKLRIMKNMREFTFLGGINIFR